MRKRFSQIVNILLSLWRHYITATVKRLILYRPSTSYSSYLDILAAVATRIRFLLNLKIFSDNCHGTIFVFKKFKHIIRDNSWMFPPPTYKSFRHQKQYSGKSLNFGSRIKSFVLWLLAGHLFEFVMLPFLFIFEFPKLQSSKIQPRRTKDLIKYEDRNRKIIIKSLKTVLEHKFNHFKCAKWISRKKIINKNIKQHLEKNDNRDTMQN